MSRLPLLNPAHRDSNPALENQIPPQRHQSSGVANQNISYNAQPPARDSRHWQHGAWHHGGSSQAQPQNPTVSPQSAHQAAPWRNGSTEARPYRGREQMNSCEFEVAAHSGYQIGGGHPLGSSLNSSVVNSGFQSRTSLPYTSVSDTTTTHQRSHRTHPSNLQSTSNRTAVFNEAARPLQQPTATWDAPRHPSSAHLHQPEQHRAPDQQPQSAAAVALAGAVSRWMQRTKPPNPEITEHSFVATTKLLSPTTSHPPQARPNPFLVRSTPQSSNFATDQYPQEKMQPPEPVQYARSPSIIDASKPHRHEPEAQQGSSTSDSTTSADVESSKALLDLASAARSSLLMYVDPRQVFNPDPEPKEKRSREGAAAVMQTETRSVTAGTEETENNAAATPKVTQPEGQQAASTSAVARFRTSNSQPLEGKPNSPPATTKDLAVPKTAQTNGQTERDSGAPIDAADMAVEMRQTLDKMRKFQNQDPALFRQIWDSIYNERRTGTAVAAPAGSSRSSSPQTNKLQSGPQTGTAPGAPAVRASSSSVKQDDKPNSNIARNGPPPNGEKIGTDKPHHLMSDHGRLPAQRTVMPTDQHPVISPIEHTARPTVLHIIRPLARQQIISPTHPQVLSPTEHAAAPPPQRLVRPPTQYHLPSSVEHPIRPPAPPPVLSPNGHPVRPPPPHPIIPHNHSLHATGAGLVPPSIRPADKNDIISKHLAQNAVALLRDNPENRGINFTAADFQQIIDSNATYVALCVTLETKGFKFHRGRFARQLLAKHPELNRASRMHPAQPTSQAASGATHGQIAPPAIQMVRNQGPRPPMDAPRGPTGSYPNPAPRGHQSAISTTHVQSQDSNASKSGQTRSPLSSTLRQPWRSQPPPGPKEASSRKRDFSEIVDLTALSDNDDYVTTKQPRVAAAVTDTAASMTTTREEPGRALVVPLHSPFSHQYRHHDNHLHHHGTGTLLTSQTVNMQLDPNEARELPPESPQKPKLILARPINQSEALRKNYYDPATVARDILIAAGRHPTERPLNAHMAGMLGVHVELNSDLATFNWDAIDAGGPPMPQVEYVEIAAAPPRYRIGERVKKRSDAEGDKAATNKDAVLGTENGLPKSAKRTAEDPPVSDTGADHSIHTPTSSRPTKRVRSLLHPEGEPSRLSQPEAPDVGSQLGAASLQTRKPPQASAPTVLPVGSHHAETRSASIPATSSNEEEKKPGASAEKMKSDAYYPSGKRGRGATGSPSKLGAVGATKDETQSLTVVAVNIPPSTPSQPVFKCRWANCAAQLHNMSTLRQHVSKKHQPAPGKQDEGFFCWWKKCRLLIRDGDGFRPGTVFDSKDEWLQHVESEHLHAIGLRLGDGPNHQHIDPQTMLRDRTRYLSDEQGRRTTPEVALRVQSDLPPDTMILLPAKHEREQQLAQESFLKLHRQQKGPMTIAEETLRAMVARKLAIGPGIDRGGCTLVNDARRATFVHNPGIRQEVDPED